MTQPVPARRADFPFTMAVPTRWSDNDMFGHVNNVTYYRFFEVAVVDFLMGTCGLDMQNGPILPFAAESLCRFKKPLSFPETVLAGMRVEHLGTSSARYGLALFAEGDDEPAAEGHWVHDLRRSPKPTSSTDSNRDTGDPGGASGGISAPARGAEALNRWVCGPICAGRDSSVRVARSSGPFEWKGVPMQPTAFFRRTYDETLDLMVEARNYLAYVERRERERADIVGGLRMSCEAMRVTSRLTQVMAWLMLQRAVYEGEIEVEDALTEPNRLSAAEVCLDETYSTDHTIPGGLRSLLDRSFHLYQRVARLEEQMLRRLH